MNENKQPRFVTLKALYITTMIATIFAGIAGYYIYLQYNGLLYKERVVVKEKIVTKTKIIKQTTNTDGMIVCVSMGDIKNDLKKNYSFLSSKQRRLVIDTIDKSSKKYNVSPIIIYGLISVESSFRFWIKSKERKVTASTGKKVRDRAIGLGSIMYSIWGEKLKQNGILETKSDLYNIDNNIMGIAYILHELSEMPLKKGTHDKMTSAMRRYFGGNYKSYSTKIKDKIGTIMFSKLL